MQFGLKIDGLKEQVFIFKTCSIFLLKEMRI